MACHPKPDVQHEGPRAFANQKPRWPLGLGPTRIFAEAATLLDKRINVGIRNGSFPVKRPHYAKSELNVTRSLSAFEDWSEDRIAVRQNGFAAVAPGVWPVLLP